MLRGMLIKKITLFFLVLVVLLLPFQNNRASAELVREKWLANNLTVGSVTNNTANVAATFVRDQDGTSSERNIETYRGKWPFVLKVIPLDQPGALPYTLSITNATFDDTWYSYPYEQWHYNWNATISLPYPGTKYAIYIEKQVELERTIEDSWNTYWGYGSIDTSSITVPASDTLIITTTGTKPPTVTDVTGIESRMDTTNTRLENIRLAINSLTSELDTTGNAIVTAENQIRDKMQSLVNATNQLVATYNTQMTNEVSALNGIKTQLATSLQGVQDAVNADRIAPTLEVYWSGGKSSTTSSTALMKIFAVDDRSAVQIKINDGSWQAYASSVTVSLSLGVNTFVVFAKDAAGNTVTKKISIFRI